MPFFRSLQQFLIGKPRNPLNPNTRGRHMVLIAFFAWIGLGADGLSSSCYGPEEAFNALGIHSSLAVFLAIATILTVFIISLAYNQVIALFPSGGGGYKVATQLLGGHAGLVSGAALIVDYILTITISVASGIDALWSFLPVEWTVYKVPVESLILVLLITLNLRGIKESIKVLMPIFLVFVITHFCLISYGIFFHAHALPAVITHTWSDTRNLSHDAGLIFVLALLLRAYSLGSGTYTGIEAVSNNVDRLAEPRVATGKWTMFYMALSLSITAGGIILLYLLWHATPQAGQTLNAVVFHSILGNSAFGKTALILTLLTEGGLLLIAANTGFLGGPSVLANMAMDGWVPKRFRHLSSRLVTQNGVILFGVASLLILWASKGDVAWLAVLYSMNVFLTFSLSILGLCVYWYKHRKEFPRKWLRHFIFSAFALLVTTSILIITLFSKFTSGGWVTVVITGIVVIISIAIKNHYNKLLKKIEEANSLLMPTAVQPLSTPIPFNPQESTAVIMLEGKNPGVGMYTLLWIQRIFPHKFKNFIFLTVGLVDVESYSAEEKLKNLNTTTNEVLTYFVNYCQQHGFSAKAKLVFGTDPVEKLSELSSMVLKECPNTIFFASKLIFEKDNIFKRFLHNEVANSMQRRLHAMGGQMIIVPMKVG